MNLRKGMGALLITAAVAGMIFSLVGLFEVWQFHPVAQQYLDDNLALLVQTLNTTQDGLTIVEQTVQTTSQDVVSLQNATRTLAQAIHDSGPMIVSLSDLTEKDLPAAIAASQNSLASAENSAKLIDDILGTLTSIPFLPVSPYKPEVPLHTSLAQVANSLNSLPSSLATIHASLSANRTNLNKMETELNTMAETVKEISNNLDKAQKVVNQYQAITSQFKTRTEAVQQAASGWVTSLAWTLTFLLIWFSIAQLGLAIEGYDLVCSIPKGKTPK